MNRTTAATLIAAAVVGIVGGSVSAVVRGSDDPRPDSPAAASTPEPSGSAGKPPSDATPTPATTPSAVAEPVETNEPLLYADGGRIHDGATVVRFAQGRRAATGPGGRRLAGGHHRLGGGRRDLQPVVPHRLDEPARRIAEVSTWDPDAEGRRVVGYDTNAGQVQGLEPAHPAR